MWKTRRDIRKSTIKTDAQAVHPLSRLRNPLQFSKGLRLPIMLLILPSVLERAPQVKWESGGLRSLSSVVNTDRTYSLLVETAVHSGRFNDCSIIQLGVLGYKGCRDIHRNHVRTWTACLLALRMRASLRWKAIS